MRSLTSRSFTTVVKTALLTSATVISLSGAVQAQTAPFAPVEVEIEGRIQYMDATGRTMTVMGTVIHVPSDAKISTPTNPNISWTDAVTGNLPGKPMGFLNGTAIVIGESDGVKVTASDISLNPEENVALGYITQNSGGTLKLDGMEIVLMPPRAGTNSFPANKSPFDPRVPGNPLKNDFGFPLARNSIVPGTPVAAEGWWSDEDSKLYLWDLEVTGGEITNPTVPKISILRAQCRQRAPNDIELEVRGATYMGTTASPAAGIEIFRVAGNGLARFVYPINVTSVPDAEDGRFALYRVDARLTNAQTGSQAGDGCPATIAARLLDPNTRRPVTTTNANGAIVNIQATSDVDNRID
ncbi:hypothetical protein JL101_013010 [Skermanella rosea]|uniref:hypothetical protein n=1 Tax=Skermanella rosea TaxID=1817965 RepID=UPI001931B812|nr:hypothetical protein [Skermanella rosea]UEM06308.1 hypothetical protein JL101_013010 [Skermanella rosea]